MALAAPPLLQERVGGHIDSPVCEHAPRPCSGRRMRLGCRQHARTTLRTSFQALMITSGAHRDIGFCGACP